MSDFDLSPPKPAALMKEAQRLSGQADTMEKDETQQRQSLFAQQDAELARRKTERDEMTKKQVGALEDMKKVEPPKTEMPNPELGPVIDPQKTKTLAFGLIALSLIGSRGKNWGMAAASMDGMLRGFKEGSLEKYQEARNKFEREMRIAKEKQAQAMESYQKILDNKKLTLNQMMVEISAQAASNQDWDINMAAKQKNLDAIYKSIDSKRRQADSLVTHAVQFQTAADTRAMMMAAKQAASSEKGWKLYQDGSGNQYRVNEGAALVQKKVNGVWQDSDTLPPNATHIGSNVALKDTVRTNLVQGAASNALNRLKEADKYGGDQNLSASPFFGVHSDGVLSNITQGVGRSALSTTQKNKDSLIAGIVDESIPVFTGGLRSSDSFRQFVISQVPRRPGDNAETTKEKWRIFRENISGQRDAFRNKFLSDPQMQDPKDRPTAGSSTATTQSPTSTKGVITLEEYLKSQEGQGR